MAAHAYDANAPIVETDATTETPEVYANYPVTGAPYYADIDDAAHNVINFFNPDDFALGLWLTIQDAKPDDLGQGYQYSETNGVFIGPGLVWLSFPNDRYDIFSFAAEARSQAVGRVPDVDGPFDPTRQVNLLLAPFGFTGTSADHSAQFNATNMQRHFYWETLLSSFGL